tara:strand:+ start:364 stop:618 length:255 start_codon:yes stop_codon:yes gene_type:complete
MKITKQRLKEIIKEEIGTLDVGERGKLEESVPMDLIGQFIGFIQKNPEVAVAAISSNAAALGIAEMLETVADKVRSALAEKEAP